MQSDTITRSICVTHFSECCLLNYADCLWLHFSASGTWSKVRSDPRQSDGAFIYSSILEKTAEINAVYPYCVVCRRIGHVATHLYEWNGIKYFMNSCTITKSFSSIMSPCRQWQISLIRSRCVCSGCRCNVGISLQKRYLTHHMCEKSTDAYTYHTSLV